MRTLRDVLLLAAPTVRTVAYLQRLVAEGLRPAQAILLDPPEGLGPGAGVLSAEVLAAWRREVPEDLRTRLDLERRPRETLEAAGVPVDVLPTADVNDPRVAAALAARPETVAIYSGPGGAILRAPLFATGKRFLHCHPGRLPAFRGSTTIYYGILRERRVHVSALFLTEEIDAGPVIEIREFPLPALGRWIDHVYDPLYRAETLAGVLARYAEHGAFPEAPPGVGPAETYSVIHPVLKHLAILSLPDRGPSPGDSLG